MRRPVPGEPDADARTFIGMVVSRLDEIGVQRGEQFDVIKMGAAAVPARSTDPVTSKLAALRNAPRRDSQRGRALEAIRATGERGATAHEVERATAITGIWKRISDLKLGGHIVVVGTRTDPVTGADGEVFRAA